MAARLVFGAKGAACATTRKAAPEAAHSRDASRPRGTMPSEQRPSALALVTLLLAMSMSPFAVVAQDDVTCCNSTDFDLYLMGEADDGTLTHSTRISRATSRTRNPHWSLLRSSARSRLELGESYGEPRGATRTLPGSSASHTRSKVPSESRSTPRSKSESGARTTTETVESTLTCPGFGSVADQRRRRFGQRQ
ncbi:MAG: hypothetical protein Ct9H300mP10_03700 [Methanobacteriota archaeon]|nr:MAG: hypothetical protein Ct9H300mP10_03700 [Euryarchaeota archaeon]